MEYKAAGICCQLVPSCAACCASLQVRLAVFSSEVTVLCQVVFGLPCFLFPGGVHLKATLGMWSWSTLRTCPSHWSRRCFSFQHYVATVCVFIQVLMGDPLSPTDATCLPETTIVECIDLFLMSLSTTRQHSELYSRTDLTLLLCSQIFLGCTALTPRWFEG